MITALLIRVLLDVKSRCFHGRSIFLYYMTLLVRVASLSSFDGASCLCSAAINITRARFGGNDQFGSTSFMAFSPVPSLSAFYEFQLKLTFANNALAWKDNLILFSGQKGGGEERQRGEGEKIVNHLTGGKYLSEVSWATPSNPLASLRRLAGLPSPY